MRQRFPNFLSLIMTPWCIITITHLHSTKPVAKFYTALAPACDMSEIFNGEKDGWN